ncbi:uncharacterized protein LOC123685974 [Harmonia axyridis]|uniref:uncharacterized protein LOC123685974 n=1 Tax=Harmonia axyridis TaxID=115357 RepID=UPI001E276B8B|nr:uncharacterized protein LOC123685974 [Harmonia axyridis]
MECEVRSWISDVFKARNFETIEVDIIDDDNKGGSLGDIIFVKVVGRAEQNIQTFNILIKRGKSNSVILDDLNLRVAYMNEINLYSKIIPFLRKFAEHRNLTPYENIPQCFGTITKEDLYVILMENLRPKGFKMCQLNEPQSLACVKLVLEAYAKWQALCLAVKDQEPDVFKTFGEINKDFQEKKMNKLYKASVKKELDFVIGLYKERCEKKMVDKLENAKNNLEDIFRRSSTSEDCSFSVIRHGDCWNNNFLFTFNEETLEPEKVVIIDWQNSFLGPPLADITQYLLSTCSLSEYERIEDLLKFYYNIISSKLIEFGSNPEKCFSWSDCYDNFKECLPRAVYSKPIFVRASLTTAFNTSFDISKSPDDGDFHGMFSDELKDSEEYFRRIDNTLKIFMGKELL